jgi:hypothetical protein
MNTTYAIAVGGRSETGDSAQVEIGNTTTELDTQAPTISQIKVDQAMYPKIDKVQTNVTWNTNELSDSKVMFWEGVERPVDETKISIKENKESALSHMVTITTLKPGTVYGMQVESTDASGQKALSKATAILTPRQQESVVQLIIKNIEDIFGFGK